MPARLFERAADLGPADESGVFVERRRTFADGFDTARQRAQTYPRPRLSGEVGAAGGATPARPPVVPKLVVEILVTQRKTEQPLGDQPFWSTRSWFLKSLPAAAPQAKRPVGFAQQRHAATVLTPEGGDFNDDLATLGPAPAPLPAPLSG